MHTYHQEETLLYSNLLPYIYKKGRASPFPQESPSFLAIALSSFFDLLSLWTEPWVKQIHSLY